MPQREPEAAESTATVGDAPHRDLSIVILAPGSTLGERYEIKAVLGTGGSSVVYRAFDRELRREVALKVLRSDRLDDASLTRFRREAAVARDTASPRLVRVFDIGSAGAAVYLPMELIEGTTLKDLLRSGSLEIDEVVRIGIEVLEALADLHTVGLLHRDVKPSNILLATDGSVKLGDLGLAYRMDGSETRATRTEAVVGTVEYLSPEQALGKVLDARSDIFSVGVVLYEMLTGELPWQRSSALGLLLARVGERAPSVRRGRPEVPRWLARAVEGMLRGRADERYGSAREAIADLERRRAPRWSLLAIRRARSRRLVAFTAALGLVLLATLWWWFGRGVASAFSHLSATETGVIAVGKRGERLWSIEDVSPLSIASVKLDHSGSRLVGILSAASDYTSERRNLLSVIEPEDGSIVETIKLPSAASSFPGHADRFGPNLWVVDLDDDGYDEVLVFYHHVPSWPSYVVLYEPLIRRARVLFEGSGHHHFAGTEDVDGDGRRELIVLGVNNRMGWYAAMAAVQIVPWINEMDRARGVPARKSPDRNYALASHEETLWYALLPTGFCRRYDECISIDRERRAFDIKFDNGEQVAIDFDGFVAGSASAATGAERRARRLDAYRQAAEATRLLNAGFGEPAGRGIELALADARASGDLTLSEWLGRSRAATLASSGRTADAQSAFRELFEQSSRRANIAFDAARAFHLHGDLEHASAWYRDGVAAGGDDSRGRPSADFVENWMLALVEQGRHVEALGELRRLETAFPQSAEHLAHLRAYIHWRQGDAPATDEVQIYSSSPDLYRYWALEFRLARAELPAVLLVEVERELLQASDSAPMLLSLKAEVLRRLDRTPEAERLAARAREMADEQAETSVAVRAHADLIRDRASRRS